MPGAGEKAAYLQTRSLDYTKLFWRSLFTLSAKSEQGTPKCDLYLRIPKRFFK